MTTWRRFKIWNQWQEVSRNFGCILLAMDSEQRRIKRATHCDNVLRFVSGFSTFKVTRAEYLSTLGSPHRFCSMVLQAYCGLVDEHARDVLRELLEIGVDVSPLLDPKYGTTDNQIEHFPSPNGVEDWGTKLLGIVHRSWSDVQPGRAKIVEALAVRGAIAHGNQEVTQRMLDRVQNVGGTLLWPINSRIILNYDVVKNYRDYLRSFVRVLSDATAEMINAHDAAGRVVGQRPRRPHKRK